MSKTKTEVKSFSEHTKAPKASAATGLNDGKLNLPSGSDSDVFAAAVVQNTAMALTEPSLAPDGTYPIIEYPRGAKVPQWKIIFSKEGQEWTYAYWAHPVVHKKFMDHIEAKHKQYEANPANYLGSVFPMPPWVALVVQFDTGLEYGSEGFMKFAANNDELQYFFVDKELLKMHRRV